MDFLSKEDAKRYEVIAEVGSGAFAKVYKARDKNCQRIVAIKVLKVEPTHQMCERFHREVNLCLELRHPNMITLYDANLFAEAPYFVMEFIDAVDLGERLESKSITLEFSLALVEQIGSALQYLHEQGIVHRDVKPGNILVKEDGHAILADFNLIFDESATALTATGHIVGTPQYLAPEQWTGSEANVRSDVYSLGRVLYELLSAGRKATLKSNEFLEPKEQKLVDLKSISPEIPAKLNDIVMKAVAYDEQKRFQRVQEFLMALENFQATEMAAANSAEGASTSNQQTSPSKHKRLYTVLLLASFLIVLGYLFPAKVEDVKVSSFAASKTIKGVLLRFDCKGSGETVFSLKSPKGKVRSKQRLSFDEEELRVLIPWKAYHPRGVLEISSASKTIFTSHCPTLERFQIGSPQMEHTKYGVTISWKCQRMSAASIEGSSFPSDLEVRYKDGAYSCLLSTESLLNNPAKIRLLVKDELGNKRRTPFVDFDQWDLAQFWKGVRAYRSSNPISRYSKMLFLNLVKAEKPAKRAMLGRILQDAEPFAEQLETFIAASPALLSSKALDFNTKLKIFKQLSLFLKIERIVDALGGESVFMDPREFGYGDFAKLRAPPVNLANVQKEDEVFQITQSEEFPVMPAIDCFQLYRQGFASMKLIEESTVLRRAIVLSESWLFRCGERASFLFSCFIDEPNYIEFVINKGAEFVLWPQKESDNRRSKINREIRFPTKLLKEGKNVLEMRHVAVLPKSGSIALVENITLLPSRLLKRGRFQGRR